MTRDQVASEKAKVRLDTASAHQETEGWLEIAVGIQESG
jgi:regulator of CtrA degradation